MIRQLPVPALCASVLALLLAAPAAAQTIYLGEHEVDTADRGAVGAAIERCTSLAAAAPDARQAAGFTRGSANPEATPAMPAGGQMPQAASPEAASFDESSAEEPVDRDALSLSVDALASSGGGSAASGEGGGSGTRPPGRSGDAGGPDGGPDEGGSEDETGSEAGADDGDALASVSLQACKEAGLVY